MSLPNEFYVTLVSDESSQYFNNNEKAFFTNKLPKTLHFNDPYCVALTEIFIPPFKLKYPSYRQVSDSEEDEKKEEKEVKN